MHCLCCLRVILNKISKMSTKIFSVWKRFLFLHRFGEVAEWSNAAVLKTVVLRGTGGSNPSFSANRCEFGCGGSVSVILESDF